MSRTYYVIVSILILLITVGCNHYGSLKQEGISYNEAKSGQILNPAASDNLAPVTGLPGSAADIAMKKYTESFASSQECNKKGAQSLLMTPISTGTGQNVYGK